MDHELGVYLKKNNIEINGSVGRLLNEKRFSKVVLPDVFPQGSKMRFNVVWKQLMQTRDFPTDRKHDKVTLDDLLDAIVIGDLNENEDILVVTGVYNRHSKLDFANT